MDALGLGGNSVGEIRLPATITETHRARTVGLEISPGLRDTLRRMRPSDRAGRVVEWYAGDLVTAARSRLIEDYDAPGFDWQSLRSTYGTYLTNASAILGPAAPFMSAKQLEHSVVVAERHYIGLLRRISREARTLDAAMQIERRLEMLAQGSPRQHEAKFPKLDVAGSNPVSRSTKTAL